MVFRKAAVWLPRNRAACVKGVQLRFIDRSLGFGTGHSAHSIGIRFRRLSDQGPDAMTGAVKIASDGQLRAEPARLQGDSTDTNKLSSLVAKVNYGPRITLQGAPKPQTPRRYTGCAVRGLRYMLDEYSAVPVAHIWRCNN
jgi:hypothetical protein